MVSSFSDLFLHFVAAIIAILAGRYCQVFVVVAVIVDL